MRTIPISYNKDTDDNISWLVDPITQREDGTDCTCACYVSHSLFIVWGRVSAGLKALPALVSSPCGIGSVRHILESPTLFNTVWGVRHLTHLQNYYYKTIEQTDIHIHVDSQREFFKGGGGRGRKTMEWKAITNAQSLECYCGPVVSKVIRIMERPVLMNLHKIRIKNVTLRYV